MAPLDVRALSVSTVSWDGHPMEAALDAVAAAGLGRVEPAFIDGYVRFTEEDLDERGAARLRAAIEARGLSVHAVSAHIDLGRNGAAERLARRIGFAAALGARCLVSNAGAASGEAAILTVLENASPALADAGLVLALENPGHGTGDMIPSGTAGATLLDRLGTPESIRLNYDLGNAWTYHRGALDPLGDLDAATPHLAFAHLKDIEEDGHDWSFVAAGTGRVGLPSLLARLKSSRPEVPLGLEMPLRLWRPGRGDPVRRAEPPSLREIDEALVRSLRALT